MLEGTIKQVSEYPSLRPLFDDDDVCYVYPWVYNTYLGTPSVYFDSIKLKIMRWWSRFEVHMVIG